MEHDDRREGTVPTGGEDLERSALSPAVTKIGHHGAAYARRQARRGPEHRLSPPLPPAAYVFGDLVDLMGVPLAVCQHRAPVLASRSSVGVTGGQAFEGGVGSTKAVGVAVEGRHYQLVNLENPDRIPVAETFEPQQPFRLPDTPTTGVACNGRLRTGCLR